MNRLTDAFFGLPPIVIFHFAVFSMLFAHLAWADHPADRPGAERLKTLDSEIEQFTDLKAQLDFLAPTPEEEIELIKKGTILIFERSKSDQALANSSRMPATKDRYREVTFYNKYLAEDENWTASTIDHQVNFRIDEEEWRPGTLADFPPNIYPRIISLHVLKTYLIENFYHRVLRLRALLEEDSSLLKKVELDDQGRPVRYQVEDLHLVAKTLPDLFGQLLTLAEILTTKSNADLSSLTTDFPLTILPKISQVIYHPEIKEQENYIRKYRTYRHPLLYHTGQSLEIISRQLVRLASIDRDIAELTHFASRIQSINKLRQQKTNWANLLAKRISELTEERVAVAAFCQAKLLSPDK